MNGRGWAVTRPAFTSTSLLFVLTALVRLAAADIAVQRA